MPQSALLLCLLVSACMSVLFTEQRLHTRGHDAARGLSRL
jgi:hypothetical protein